MPPLNTTKRTCLALAVSQAIVMPLHAATITVDSTLDAQVAGICTLRSAIIAANTNTAVDSCVAGSVSGRDIIDLTGLPNNSTINLSADALPSIKSSISLNGPGQDDLTISGYDDVLMFEIRGGENSGQSYAGDLIVSSMTFSNGEPRFRGGGVFFMKAYSRTPIQLEINDTTFYNNEQPIYADNDSTVTINNSTFDRNEFDAIHARGSGVVIINNSIISGTTRGLGVYATSTSIVTINNSTVSDNLGGGVNATSGSTVTITNSAISGNSASFGGGVRSGGRGTVIINNSTISGNSARFSGAGVSSLTDSTMTINNSTLSNNSSYSAGGAVFSNHEGEININNSTVVNNSAGRRSGGGVYSTGDSSVSISNTIVAGNTAGNTISNGPVEIDLRTTITPSLQNNVIGSRALSSLEAFGGFTPNASNIITTSDQLNVPLNRIIEPLANNGGQTRTHALPADSPALNSGNNTNCPSIDQRGEPRDDGACDIGAVEGPLDDESFFVVPLKNDKAVIFSL